MKKWKIIFSVFFCSIITISFFPILVKAESTIIINHDGTITGPNLLDINNDTYVFLSNISGNIVVLKDFITIDGSGFTLKGGGDSQTGIDLALTKNVTVKNLIISDYFTGIHCRPRADTRDNITILGNYIKNCDIGIEFQGSSNNLIKFNTFENNSIDISLNYVLGDNLITQNTIDRYVQVWMSDQPTIDMNYWTAYDGTDTDGDGIGDSPHYYREILQDSHPLMDPVPVIPEFPSGIIFTLFITATLVLRLARKKLEKLTIKGRAVS